MSLPTLSVDKYKPLDGYQFSTNPFLDPPKSKGILRDMLSVSFLVTISSPFGYASLAHIDYRE